MKRILMTLACVLGLVAGGATVVTASMASATTEETCTPQDGYTETSGWVLESPGAGWYKVDERTVTDKEAYDEVIPGTGAIWANFSPTKPKTFVGPPSWPTDERGKWNVHDQIPPGHAGPDGVYSKGNPNKGGNWFYRQAGTPDEVVHHDAVTHKEFKFAFDHPAIDCPPPTEEPTPTDTPTTEQPCETDYNGEEEGCGTPPTDTPTTPTDTPTTPSAPTETPTTPQTQDAPPVTVENSCSASKCVKITKDSSGKIVDKQVVKYDNPKEEGL